MLLATRTTLVLTSKQQRARQFTLLRTIAAAGEIAHCDLARQSVGSVETFSRRLVSARRSGWVEMCVGERQRRVYRLRDKGKQVLSEALHLIGREYRPKLTTFCEWTRQSSGICTMVRRRLLFSCSNSQRSESVKPRMACFAPQ